MKVYEIWLNESTLNLAINEKVLGNPKFSIGPMSKKELINEIISFNYFDKEGFVCDSLPEGEKLTNYAIGSVSHFLDKNAISELQFQNYKYFLMMM